MNLHSGILCELGLLLIFVIMQREILFSKHYTDILCFRLYYDVDDYYRVCEVSRFPRSASIYILTHHPQKNKLSKKAFSPQ